MEAGRGRVMTFERGAWKYEYFAMQLREHMCAKNCRRYIRRAYIFNVERLQKGGRLGKLLRSYLPCKFDEMQILLKTLPTGRERERERAYSCMWNVANVDDDDDYRNPRRYPHPVPLRFHIFTLSHFFSRSSLLCISSSPPPFASLRPNKLQLLIAVGENISLTNSCINERRKYMCASD